MLLELPNDFQFTQGSVYFAIGGKKVHLKTVSILPLEAKKNGKLVLAELLPVMTN